MLASSPRGARRQNLCRPDAIAYLLGRRGNWILGFIVRASGPLGCFGYKWVAGHRNSLLIRTATKFIERSL